jgi:hypothetical protein
MSSSAKGPRGPQFDPDAFRMEDDAAGGTDAPGIGRKVEDLLRKTMLTSVGALFMTEEGIRNLVGELKLPREITAYVVGQAEKTRRDLAGAIAREVTRFFESSNVSAELRKVLTNIGVEANVSLRFVDLTDQQGEGGEPPERLRIKTKVLSLSDED